MAGSTDEGPLEEEDGLGWPVVKVFDVVALVLVVAVVLRAVGGIVAAFGVPSFHLDFGALSGSGVAVNQSDFPLPTYRRLQYGTEWADLITGMLVLAGVALLALPRMLWDVEEGSGLGGAAQLVVGTGIVATLACVGSVVEIVNLIWNTSLFNASSEAISVAAAVATSALTALAAILSWSSRRLLRFVP